MKLGELEINTIHKGDCQLLSKSIPDNSIDIVFTDPPYPKEYIHLYEWLAKESSRILKAGGLCIALAGHIYLDEIIQSMGRHLDWHWIGGMPNTLGSVGRVHPRQMMCGWKPMLWFSKGKANKHAYVFDFFRTKPDKRYHDWGQPASWAYYYLDKLTSPGNIVFEPFTGGGSTLVACYYLSLNYLAFELDDLAYKEATQRMKNLQPSFFTRTGKPNNACTGAATPQGKQRELFNLVGEQSRSDNDNAAP